MEKFIFYKGKYYTKESIKHLIERNNYLRQKQDDLYDVIFDYIKDSKDILKDDFCFGGYRVGFLFVLFIVTFIKIGTLS